MLKRMMEEGEDIRGWGDVLRMSYQQWISPFELPEQASHQQAVSVCRRPPDVWS